MTTKFFVSLDNFAPLANAAVLLSNISHEADVKVSRTQFSIIAADRSRCYVAALHIWEPFFADYYVDEDMISSRISLPAFHRTMKQARKDRCSSMIIHMPKTQSQNHLLLEFQNSITKGNDGIHKPRITYEKLILSPPQEEDLNQIQIDHQNFFIISSNDFRRVIREVSHLPNALVVVTITNSQVKFSIPSKEIVLIKQAGQCQIVGYEGEVETRLRIILHPTWFFLSLSTHSEAIWFHKTISNFAIISIQTAECYVDYAIHFLNI